MEWVIGWLIFAIVVGVIASSKRRSGFGWFLLAVLISPLIAVIAVAAMPPVEPPKPEEPTKACPRCAETVKMAAAVCRYCGHEFGQQEPTGNSLQHYKNVPYRLHSDGQVSMVVEGKVRKWPNVEVFQAAVDRNQARLGQG